MLAGPCLIWTVWLAWLAPNTPPQGLPTVPLMWLRSMVAFEAAYHRHLNVPRDHCCPAVSQLDALYGTCTCRAHHHRALTAL